MFSLLFGKRKKKQKKNKASGTGYGGHVVNDAKRLKKEREKALTRGSSFDKDTIAFLLQSAPLVRDSSLQEKEKLVSTLRQVFRSQVPTEWGKHKKLLLISLTTLSLVLQNYKELLGDANETDSLAAAFAEFAQHAQFLDKHNEGKEHARMVEKILDIQAQIGLERKNGILPVDATVEQDVQTLYRSKLAPLRFDLVESLENHPYSSNAQSTKLNMKTLFQELSSFGTALPVEYGSSIFVRAVESRLDLLRVLIIGPEDTPYANGCFLFDVFLNDYPQKPPKVQFLTTGGGRVRFNPNLYSNGKVCLSLLGTWDGPGWIPGESTLLQVLVSLQSLIFVAEPYYNEPVLPGRILGSSYMRQKSLAYNANIRRHAMNHAMLPFINGSSHYREFQDVMKQHYTLKKDAIKLQVQQWAKDDASLVGLATQVSSKFPRRSKVDKTRKAVTPTTPNGSKSPSKKQRTVAIKQT